MMEYGSILMEGPLSKWTNVMNGWQFRWFVLDRSTALLTYYTSRDKMVRGERRGCVKLRGALIGIDDEDDSTFTITTQDRKVFHFQERQLTSRVRGLTDADSTERDRANQIVDSLRQVIELIKQVIVALQMSKQDLISPLYSGAHQLAVPSGLVPPSDALIEGESIFYDHHATSVSDSSVTAAGAAAATATSPMQAASAANLVDFASRQVAAAAAAAAAAGGATSVVTSDAQPQRRSSDSGATSSSAAAVAAAAAAAAASNALIPATSFSSDEDDGDDDEFYDAEEGAAAAAADGSNSAGSGSVFVPEVIGSDDDCNYDELYDDMNESNLGNLDDGEHGSVIGHLISQVRIGMDLTKIVLPTFILERRSTLEMYADFLAHPDLWSDIPNHSHPRDRMIACLKWYLSAFHAGRRSAVAKKPYNPILGERLLRVMLDGYIWTKSKFLGLSIAVQMVGQAVISLLDYDEEYIVTFPSGYGRSILTVPWIELVGKCRIECPRTGYSASVDFLAKPFYGGKKDKVLSQVFAPGEKKPFLTVEGLWNGQMYSRWTSSGLDASSTPPNSSASPQPPAPPHPPLEQQQVFIDTQHMPVIKKRVRPRAEQAPNESRRLWEGVTRSLKTGDIPSATEFKSRLEQEQRDAAKARLERGERWRQRHFREVGEHWVYHSPLSRR
uniref:PH domain-containing protein n=1 Tax=Macrostomum lignano TaxID=282301 RepID=A0A1I8I4M4_9PLAT